MICPLPDNQLFFEDLETALRMQESGDWWHGMAKGCFPNFPPKYVNVEMVISKIKETNICDNDIGELAVWIDSQGRNVIRVDAIWVPARGL